MYFRPIIVFFIIYLIYRGIKFMARIVATINSGNNSANNNSKDSKSAKSKFKDVEEASYIEIKDDKKKDPH